MEQHEEFIGYIIDQRYRINELLGAGGFGMVFSGTHQILGKNIRDVAIKIIKEKIPIGKEVSVLAEAFTQINATANIPDVLLRERVAAVYDFGIIKEKDNRGFIIMELVNGSDLSTVIEDFNGPIPPDTVMRYMLPVIEGMAGLHKLNPPIVHRDLKPENVLITKDEKIKITDFGLSVRLDEVRGWAEGVAGTRIYMSAEALAGESNAASDVFSLGTMWYKMLTGKFPFDEGTMEIGQEDDAARLRRMHLRKTVVPDAPVKLNRTCPEHISRIVMRCLEYDLSKRFRDADQLLKVLQDRKMSVEEYLREAELNYGKKMYSESRRLAEAGLKASPKNKTKFLMEFLHILSLAELQREEKREEIKKKLDELYQEDTKLLWINRGDGRKYLWEKALEFYKGINDFVHVRLIESRLKKL